MSHKKRILLIEDEEDIAALIKLQAEASGYKMHVEVDGINGYRAIEREKPDLVILDIMLPGQNGFDVCRKMKANPDLRSIPVIILTALCNPGANSPWLTITTYFIIFSSAFLILTFYNKHVSVFKCYYT